MTRWLAIKCVHWPSVFQANLALSNELLSDVVHMCTLYMYAFCMCVWINIHLVTRLGFSLCLHCLLVSCIYVCYPWDGHSTCTAIPPDEQCLRSFHEFYHLPQLAQFELLCMNFHVHVLYNKVMRTLCCYVHCDPGIEVDRVTIEVSMLSVSLHIMQSIYLWCRCFHMHVHVYICVHVKCWRVLLHVYIWMLKGEG